MRPSTTPDASDLNFVTDVILLTAGSVVSAWVWTVTPERWWNAPSADSRLEMQVQRDPVTATLGCVLVFAIWAVAWFLVVIPAATRTDNTLGILFHVGTIGTASWVVSSALARRWLIGKPSTGPLYSLLLDAGFALIVFFWGFTAFEYAIGAKWLELLKESRRASRARRCCEIPPLLPASVSSPPSRRWRRSGSS